MSQNMIAMRGTEYYTQNTVGAKLVIDIMGDPMADALSSTNLSQCDRSFAIADFVSADGGTSLDLMRRLIKIVRTAHATRAIMITFTSLPGNDFSALLRCLHHDNAAIPLTHKPGVHTFASGTAFYWQIFPDDSLALGFSATATHWLSNERLGDDSLGTRWRTRLR